MKWIKWYKTLKDYAKKQWVSYVSAHNRLARGVLYEIPKWLKYIDIKTAKEFFDSLDKNIKYKLYNQN